MKRTTVLLFAGLFLLLLSSTSCKNKEKDIIGTWRIENIEIKPELSQSEKVNFDLFLSQVKESAHFTFKSDYKYESLFNTESSKGTWELAEKGQQLITKLEGEDADTARIEILSSSSLILISESDGVTTKIIMKK